MFGSLGQVPSRATALELPKRTSLIRQLQIAGNHSSWYLGWKTLMDNAFLRSQDWLSLTNTDTHAWVFGDTLGCEGSFVWKSRVPPTNPVFNHDWSMLILIFHHFPIFSNSNCHFVFLGKQLWHSFSQELKALLLENGISALSCSAYKGPKECGRQWQFRDRCVQIVRVEQACNFSEHGLFIGFLGWEDWLQYKFEFHKHVHLVPDAGASHFNRLACAQVH